MNFEYLLSVYITMALGLWLQTQAELFTAMADMEPLLSTHKTIIDSLEDYIAKEDKRLADLKKHLDRYKKEHVLAMKDTSDYLENPINAFTLIKRLTKDLSFIQKNILVSADNVTNITADNPDLIYPTLEDLTGAIQALTRLQNTYRLDIGELAEGRVIGKFFRGRNDSATSGTNDPATSTPMTASDCYELGRTLYNVKDYHNSLRWMMESLRKLNSGDDLYDISEVDVLEYISFTHYLLGDIKNALEWTKKLLVLDPKHPKASGNVRNFQKTVDDNELKMKRKGETGEDVDNHDEGSEQSKTSVSVKSDMMVIYEALCRGDIDIPREMQRRLKCSYLTKNHSFLKLAPIKMEQIYIGPDVFLFHEVMSDEEIEHLKNLAKPKISRAGVNDPDSKKAVAADYRISKTAWLHDDASETVKRVTRRTADFTGFSMDTAEELQVANYGIGGHYEPHFDYYPDDDSIFIPHTGQRIATVLFYMSDVAQGGATVFTELGLSVFPIKNSALFWNNLLPLGKGNPDTRHAACPVLRGSKWASNKWIHVVGQELIRPCSIELRQ